LTAHSLSPFLFSLPSPISSGIRDIGPPFCAADIKGGLPPPVRATPFPILCLILQTNPSSLPLPFLFISLFKRLLGKFSDKSWEEMRHSVRGHWSTLFSLSPLPFPSPGKINEIRDKDADPDRRCDRLFLFFFFFLSVRARW